MEYSVGHTHRRLVDRRRVRVYRAPQGARRVRGNRRLSGCGSTRNQAVLEACGNCWLCVHSASKLPPNPLSRRKRLRSDTPRATRLWGLTASVTSPEAFAEPRPSVVMLAAAETARGR